MIGLFFAAAGFASGLYFGVIPFVILMLAAGFGYAAIQVWSAVPLWTVALDVVIALVCGQVGYVLAIIFRVIQRKKAYTKAPIEDDTSNKPAINGTKTPFRR